MSFADAVREELQRVPLRRACCKRALAAGLLIDADVQGQQIVLPCRSSAAAGYLSDVIRRQFGKAPLVREEVVRRHRSVCLAFASPSAARLVRCFDTHTVGTEEGEKIRLPERTDPNDAPVRTGPEPFPQELLAPGWESGRSASLRGAFLSVGTLNAPHTSTHLELTLRHSSRAGFLAAFLTACGYPPGVIHRSGGVGLYYKNGTSAEDLVALAGAGKSAMEMMNIRIEREIRNQENRATNCVAKNIEKSVSASARQMAAIEKLTLTGMLAQLPEPLRVTARLRAEHPDATLEELRLLHLPPITKSGLNHRLQKLIEEADKP